VVRSPNWTESWKVSMDYQGKRTVLNRVSLLSMCFTTHLFTFYLNFLHTNPCLFPSTKPENSFSTGNQHALRSKIIWKQHSKLH